jgi:hypothetical protein
MMAGNDCDCLICRLEASFIAELNDDRSHEEFRLFAVSRSILSSFPTALELVRKLRDFDNRDQNPSSDEVLLDFLARMGDTSFRAMWQQLLLLVFIPTIHRTTSLITATFPLLTRDDTAQYLFTVFLEFLPSKELGSRRSHLGFTITRQIRRSAFRWAIREFRTSLRNETDGTRATILEADISDEDSRADILLEQFLGDCQRRGWLSSEERELLIQFKLEGISGPELARRAGHSAVAMRHRVQRLLDRLRRIAQPPGDGTSEQLDLFLP